MSEDFDVRVITEDNGKSIKPFDIDYLAVDDSDGTDTSDSSLADDLPSDVTFDVMAFGGQATVCATAPMAVADDEEEEGRKSLISALTLLIATLLLWTSSHTAA